MCEGFLVNRVGTYCYEMALIAKGLLKDDLSSSHMVAGSDEYHFVPGVVFECLYQIKCIGLSVEAFSFDHE